MSDITIEQAEQQLEQAKQREANESKPWEMHELDTSHIGEFSDKVDELEEVHTELESARETLQDEWNSHAEEYNSKVHEYNTKLSELRGFVAETDWAEDLEVYFAQEDEENSVIVDDKTRQLLLNAEEKREELTENWHEEAECEEENKYVEEVDTSVHTSAQDLKAQLELLATHIDAVGITTTKSELSDEDKELIESWGNNQSVWQVYDFLKDKPEAVRKSHLKYALEYYTEEGTGYYTMLKEMATEFGITDES